MMEKKLTDDMIDSLKEDYGVLSTKEITEKYSCSYSTIERFCKAHGFKSKRKPTCQTKPKYQYLSDNLNDFLEDWEDNILTDDELVKKYKAPITALYSQATLYGKHRKSIEEKINIQELITDYQNKVMSQKDILDKYCISQRTKNKILKDNDIKIDSPGVRKRKYYFDEHFLDVIDSEEKAYFLGFVYADGGHNEEKHTLSITLQNRDDDLLKQFYNMFKCDRQIYFIYNKKYDKYYSNFCLQSVYLSQQLLKLGIPQDKSFKITFPTFLPKNLFRHFIRGYFDGDGCISFAKRGWKSTAVSFVGNEYFLKSIKEIIYCNTSKDMKIHQRTNSGIYTLNSSGIFNVYAILKYLYEDSTIYLQRKYDRYVNFKTQYEKGVS